MQFLGRISIIAAAVLSAAYSVYAITQYRRAWNLCRGRLIVPRSVQLFHVYLSRNGFIGSSAHFPFLHPGNKCVATATTSDGITTTGKEKSEAAEAVTPPLSDTRIATAAITSSSSPSLLPAVGGTIHAGVSEALRGPGELTSSMQLAWCPVAFVDNTAFEANVRSVGLALLAGKKQIRLSTINMRCPELLERAAVLLERLAHPCVEYDTITPETPFVAGLCTSTALEMLWWANRGSFASLLLSRPLTEAVDAEMYLEAMTLHTPGKTKTSGNEKNKSGSGAAVAKVRCSVVVNAVRQLELLWGAAKAWIRDNKYTKLGFDNAVESLEINVIILVDPSLQPMNLFDTLQKLNPKYERMEEKNTGDTSSYGIRTEQEVMDFFTEVENFNTKMKKEKLPVGVQFIIQGISFAEGTHVACADVGPVATEGISCCIPARWFMSYPLMKWYKNRAEQHVKARRRSILRWLAYKKQLSFDNFIITGGSSASLVNSANDDTLTEVCIGSGLLCDQRLDRYIDSIFTPALFFALTTTRVVMCNSRRLFLCSGFGESLPSSQAVYPMHLQTVHGSLCMQMDPEVEIAVASRQDGNTDDSSILDIGVPVVFRPQRNSVLAELVDVYLLIAEDGTAVEVLPTYRGERWNVWSGQHQHIQM
ncbi:amino acid aldolase [Trypanosoma theileri]|uniref:Amino acid aldolase n=1 Tax=Trypanosoma theileri TaxID=67003 RepID=A0A1X0NIH0_9TRYP|nr:amino acid aldolase [Trypanosoma theileri]ORC84318.1 amino acid aldolase [Trypanosoma theileri]